MYIYIDRIYIYIYIEPRFPGIKTRCIEAKTSVSEDKDRPYMHSSFTKKVNAHAVHVTTESHALVDLSRNYV